MASRVAEKLHCAVILSAAKDLLFIRISNLQILRRLHFLRMTVLRDFFSSLFSHAAKASAIRGSSSIHTPGYTFCEKCFSFGLLALKGQQGVAGGNAPGIGHKSRTDPEGVAPALRRTGHCRSGQPLLHKRR
jgi:hypothetical protein